MKFVAFFACLLIFPGRRVAQDARGCNDSAITPCLKKLETFIMLNDLHFVKTDIELDRLCSDAFEGYRCANNLFLSKECILPQYKIHQNKERNQALTSLLCIQGEPLNPAFRLNYLKHTLCIQRHYGNVKNCYSKSRMPDDLDVIIAGNSTMSEMQKYKNACCPIEKYIHCVSDTIDASCRGEAKNVISTMIRRAAGQEIHIFCSKQNPIYPILSDICAASSESLQCLSLLGLLMFTLISSLMQ